MLPCPKPPIKEVLLAKVAAAVMASGHPSTGVDSAHRPDTKWLLDVLSTLSPDDEIFRRDYVAPPRKPALPELRCLKLPSALVQGLPISSSKSRARKLKSFGHAKGE